MHARPLIAAERYYAFLDCVAPMNLLHVADLDRVFAADEVGQRWADFVRVRSLPRLRVQPELTLADGPRDDVAFRSVQLDSSEWDGELAVESREPFGFDRPARLCYLTSPAEGRSRIVLAVHHAIADGRVGIAEVQRFVRSLDGQPVEPLDGVTEVVPATATYPWQADRRRLVELLREIAAGNEATGAPEPAGWPAAEATAEPRFVSLAFDAPDTTAFLSAARARGLRAYAALAAAWLATARSHFGDILQLATPPDLAGPGSDPSRPTSPIVPVLGTRYVVPADRAPWDLGTAIAARLDTALARGEGELFFHLTRVDKITDVDAGVAAIARALAAAPPSFCVSNLGVIDPGSDPDWLRTVYVYLAPSPNQVTLITGIGYRGGLTHGLATDESRLAPDVATAMVSEYVDRIRRMGAAQG